ncbi:MAG: NlpC/P60 family protein [Humidesulfovibrio sp.]|nr:NlpC/P60 family protein [Humidesulfovibrio sp.]
MTFAPSRPGNKVPDACRHSPAVRTALPPGMAMALLAGLVLLLTLSACAPASVSSLRAPIPRASAGSFDPILAQNSGLLAEQHLPESEQAPVAAPPMPTLAPGLLSARPAPFRLKPLAEAPPKATDIPEFPSLDDLEVEARLERLSKLPPSFGLDIVRTGLTQKGRRYRWGGAIPSTGFDCSGFTQWTFRQHDITIPRTAREQFHVGEHISRHELRPGDLVFYKINRRGRWHVGIYMDDGIFVHSPRRGRSISEANMDASYWSKRYMGARRYVR